MKPRPQPAHSDPYDVAMTGSMLDRAAMARLPRTIVPTKVFMAAKFELTYVTNPMPAIHIDNTIKFVSQADKPNSSNLFTQV